jgi:hypothetical protein
LSSLSVLTLYGATGITSLEPLRALSSLSVLDLTGATGITSLEPLRGLSSLSVSSQSLSHPNDAAHRLAGLFRRDCP